MIDSWSSSNLGTSSGFRVAAWSISSSSIWRVGWLRPVYFVIRDEGFLVYILDNLSIYQLIYHPIQTFSTLNHVNHEHSLEMLILFLCVIRKLYFLAINNYHRLTIFQLTVKPNWSNQIKIILDPNDRESKMKLLHLLSNHLVNIAAFSWTKNYRNFSEKLFTLLVKFFLRDTKLFEIIVWGGASLEILMVWLNHIFQVSVEVI